MLYIYPVGGLGNMLFHIAAVWTLAQDNHDELCLLNINKKIDNLVKDDRGDYSHAGEFLFLFNRFKNTEGSARKIIKVGWFYSLLQYKKESEYRGYFQSEKYFKHRRSELVNLFREDESFMERINKYSHLFNNIGLHVRRGDYISKYSHVYEILPVEYYRTALERLPEELPVAVFSDDLNWCSKNFVGSRYSFIDEKDYISLYIMSKMKYHIIANSSFSWWGAWLSENKVKVFSPRFWFRDRSRDRDLIPEDWERV